MCGPIAAYSARTTKAGSVHYQIGRALSYAAAGAFAGVLGEPVIRIVWGSELTLALSYALALLMAVAAYRAWPRSHARKKAEASADTLVQITPRGEEATKTGDVSRLVRLLERFPRQPLLLGAFSVLIPCAALWGGLVIAASSGSVAAGALAMLAFSLTSGTGLLASGFLAKTLGRRPSHQRLLSLVFVLGAAALVARPISMHLQQSSQDSATSQSDPVSCPLHSGGQE